MRRFRTTPKRRGACRLSRGLLPLLAGLFVAAVLVPAGGADSRAEAGKVPRLVFPLVAKTILWDNYGDPRGNGSHAGIDMENPWRAPVVAVEPGKVEYATSSLGGCMLYLYGRSGTMYLYIHLNNDLTAKNDNKAGCVKGVGLRGTGRGEGLAGQQVAYNGDSGDANGNPHLHFEVHPNGGSDVNPFRHLTRAHVRCSRPASARPSVWASAEISSEPAAGRCRSTSIACATIRAVAGSRSTRARWSSPFHRRQTSRPELTAKLGVQVHRLIATPTSLTVHTTKERATAEAIVGAAGALGVSRISPDG